jgi:hypothetical protein
MYRTANVFATATLGLAPEAKVECVAWDRLKVDAHPADDGLPCTFESGDVVRSAPRNSPGPSFRRIVILFVAAMGAVRTHDVRCCRWRPTIEWRQGKCLILSPAARTYVWPSPCAVHGSIRRVDPLVKFLGAARHTRGERH